MPTTPDVATLEHVAGAFSLELVNSATGIARAGFDWLSNPASAQAWAGSLGLRLGNVSDAELTALRTTREAIHRVFRAIADHTAAPSADLDAVTSAQVIGLSGWPLEQHGGEFRRAWPAADTAASLAARAADDAIELLRHARLDRIGSCERCGWLFLDISRNGRRRWCSMLSCGAKEKARRHYERAAATTRVGTRCLPLIPSPRRCLDGRPLRPGARRDRARRNPRHHGRGHPPAGWRLPEQAARRDRSYLATVLTDLAAVIPAGSDLYGHCQRLALRRPSPELLRTDGRRAQWRPDAAGGTFTARVGYAEPPARRRIGQAPCR